MKIHFLNKLFLKLSHEPLISWVQLKHNKTRLLVALSGIAFANVLIFMMQGFQAILFDGSIKFHKQIDADLVLISKRTQSLMEGQTFSRSHLYRAAGVEGVKSADALYYSLADWVNPWNKEVVKLAVVAFNPERPVLNIPQINQQLHTIKLPNIILFDGKSQPTLGSVKDSFIRGEEITTEISGNRVRVGGIFDMGGTVFIKGHAVTSDWNYLRLFGGDSLSKVHVGVLKLNKDANLEKTRLAIKSILPSDVRVITLKQFEKTETDYWAIKNPTGPLFNFGATMGLVVGAVVVYQILYTDISEHLKEYATLKAIGYTSSRLLIVVLTEGIILAILGFIPGFIISSGMYSLLATLTKIPLVMKLDIVINIFLMTVFMCLASATIAMQKLNYADPADIF